MLKRIGYGILSALLVVSMSIPSFAQEPTSSEPYDPTEHYVVYDDGEREVKPIDEAGVPTTQLPEGGGQCPWVIEEDGSIEVSPRWWEEPWTKVSNPTAVPYRKIAALEILYTDGTKEYGTGCMVDSSGKVLTAAHCLRTTTGKTASKITMRFGRAGSNSFLQTTSTRYVVNEEWDTNQNASYDYGVIIVPSSVAKTTGSFGWTSALDSSKTFTLAGYPYAGPYTGKYMYKDSGKIDESDVYTKKFDHFFNCGPGCSGAPFFDSGQYVVGIHTWGNKEDVGVGGTATKFTKDVANLIKNAS